MKHPDGMPFTPAELNAKRFRRWAWLAEHQRSLLAYTQKQKKDLLLRQELNVKRQQLQWLIYLYNRIVNIANLAHCAHFFTRGVIFCKITSIYNYSIN